MCPMCWSGFTTLRDSIVLIFFHFTSLYLPCCPHHLLWGMMQIFHRKHQKAWSYLNVCFTVVGSVCICPHTCGCSCVVHVKCVERDETVLLCVCSGLQNGLFSLMLESFFKKKKPYLVVLIASSKVISIIHPFISLCGIFACMHLGMITQIFSGQMPSTCHCWGR